MVKFIGKRLAYAVLTLFLITTATFFLVAGAPGDPIAAKVGQMPEQAQQIIREKYGLDQPVVKRYTTYMKNLLTTGDFGESIIYTGQSANDIIKNNTLVSAKIGLLGLLFQTTIGICLGMVAALNRGKPVDHVIRVLVVLAICVPSFVFASVLQYFLAFKWKLVPVFGWGQMKHYILPVAAYAIGGIASYTKYMRSSTLSVIGEDYIITAKAKGCTKKRVVRKHVLRNAMLPIITMIGPSLAGIFAGAGYDNFRSRIFTVRTKKCITTCIKSGNRSIDGVNSVMVSSFPVLGFMIDGGTMDFNLADGVVTLEVCHIVHCIPETELYIRKNGKMLFFFTVVGHGQLIDLAGASNRNEVCQLCGKIIFASFKNGITDTVMTFIGIQISLGWHPARIPDGISFFNIVVMSVAVSGNIVVTVSGKT